jgi:PhzF family phenazine biosynthesis protein
VKSVKVYHYDAFSKEPNKGNPAGVVLNGDDLTDKEMQEIAFKVGFNETAFPVKSDVADLRLRFFTPGHAMNLCGHATMATIYTLSILIEALPFVLLGVLIAGIIQMFVTEEMVAKMIPKNPVMAVGYAIVLYTSMFYPPH